MAAFDPSRMQGGAGTFMDEVFSQMFGHGGMPPGFGGGGPRRPRRGEDEVQDYPVTLEELYKGKSARFTSNKNVICSHCKGKGGKENTKPKTCEICRGSG